MGNQGPKTGMERQSSLPLFLPALLMLSACLLAHLRVDAHIPFLSLGTFSPERAALLGDLAWPGEGRGGREGKRRRVGRLRFHMKWNPFRGWERSRPGMCVCVPVCVCLCLYLHVCNRAGVKVGGKGGREGLRGKLRNEFIFCKMEIRVWWFMATISMNIRVSPREEPWKPQVSFYLGEDKAQLTHVPGYQSQTCFKIRGKLLEKMGITNLCLFPQWLSLSRSPFLGCEIVCVQRLGGRSIAVCEWEVMELWPEKTFFTRLELSPQLPVLVAFPFLFLPH